MRKGGEGGRKLKVVEDVIWTQFWRGTEERGGKRRGGEGGGGMRGRKQELLGGV